MAQSAEVLLVGLLTGILMSVMLGTVFFALVQNSINYGFRTGLFIAAGVILSDIVLITLSWFNLEILGENATGSNVVRVLGAIFLFVYGLSNLLRKPSLSYPETVKRSIVRFVITGFMLNILNPGNYFGWVVVTTNIKGALDYSLSEAILFYTAALGGIFAAETAISFAAARIKQFINTRVLLLIQRIFGTAFVLLSLWLLKPLFFD